MRTDVRDTTADYLAALDRALIGPTRVRRGLVREAGDHLQDATDAYRRAGYADHEAQHRAVADFGGLDEVAPAFQVTLSVAAARRTALLLLGALIIQPFLWDGGLRLADAAHAQAPADSWFYAVLDGFVEYGGFVTLLGAVGVLGLTTIGQRRWHFGRRTARAVASYALGAAFVVPLTGIGMLALAGGVTPGLLLLTAALMVLPLAGVGWSARRTLAAC